ncbi:FliH/SctL family protein [Kurthia huakuii]|uniref:FliH/SctL family protein n=1 Tax=Kurthia huakuii TaxID=1421019 RepID=UPI001F2B813C|nr:FliH/SctL family protein [Kurthia huakuii]
MTLLSRIYRPGTGMDQPNIRTIEIREFMVPTVDEDNDVVPDISLEQLYAERDQLLEEARQEIALKQEQFKVLCTEKEQTLIEAQQQWQEEKLQLQQQAYDEGFTQGIEEGRNKALENMSRDIQIANDTMAQSEKNAQAYLDSQESVILELAIRSAQRILNVNLEQNPSNYVHIIERALKEVRESDFVKIYVAAENHVLLTQNRDELVAMFPPNMPFMIFIDEDLSNQECYIDTNHGRLIASIDEQLNELRHHLSELLESVE